MKTMSFQDFLETRTANMEIDGLADEVSCGYTYANYYHIIDVRTSGGNVHDTSKGRWFTILERCSWITDDLYGLAWLLYAYACGDAFQPPPCEQCQAPTSHPTQWDDHGNRKRKTLCATCIGTLVVDGYTVHDNWSL